MKRTAVIFGAALLAATTTATAQGYFEFGEIPGVKGEPTVEVDLGPTMLALINGAAQGVSAAGSEEAAVAAAALEGVTNVRVRVYEDIEVDAAALQKFVADSSAALARQGWERVVRVNEDGEQVYVFVKANTASNAAPGSISGITVMVMDQGAGSEAVFINVAGTFLPQQLGQIAGAVGMNGVFNGVPGLPTQQGP